MGIVLDQWKKVKSRYKELADTTKYKPDVTPLIVKFEDGLTKLGQLKDEREKADQDYQQTKKKLSDDFRQKLKANSDALKKFDDALSAVSAEIEKSCQGVAWRSWTANEGSQKLLVPLATKYDDSQKQYRSLLVAQSQLIKDDGAATKQLDTQYQAKKTNFDTTQKKLKDDGDKLVKQITDVFEAYEEATTDKALQKDINGVLGTVDAAVREVID
jgi:hypothetical protein